MLALSKEIISLSLEPNLSNDQVFFIVNPGKAGRGEKGHAERNKDRTP